MLNKGTLFVISAPSGAGKTSLVNALVQKIPQLQVSVSHTTRPPRVGEVHGKNYFFIEEAAFQDFRQQNLFLESAQVFNHWYGSSRAWVLEQLQQGIDVILEIDWQGAQSVKVQQGCISIFILPPSREILLDRLQCRSQDSEVVIKQRMSQASSEISHYSEYDFIVINDDFAQALTDLMTIIQAQRLRTSAQQHRHQQLITSLMR